MASLAKKLLTTAALLTLSACANYPQRYYYQGYPYRSGYVTERHYYPQPAYGSGYSIQRYYGYGIPSRPYSNQHFDFGYHEGSHHGHHHEDEDHHDGHPHNWQNGYPYENRRQYRHD